MIHVSFHWIYDLNNNELLSIKRSVKSSRGRYFHEFVTPEHETDCYRVKTVALDKNN